ncbi:MAG TPA: hypothetical protein VGS41_00355 [Chthonomonadales bacterium]|nr:hypothetical protein [Chthonomonadales bacterium]
MRYRSCSTLKCKGRAAWRPLLGADSVLCERCQFQLRRNLPDWQDYFEPLTDDRMIYQLDISFQDLSKRLSSGFWLPFVVFD